MVQVEMSNMYIDMGVNNGSEKLTEKNTAAGSSVSILCNSFLSIQVVEVLSISSRYFSSYGFVLL